LSGAITRPGTLGWGSGFLHGSFPGIHLSTVTNPPGEWPSFSLPNRFPSIWDQWSR